MLMAIAPAIAQNVVYQGEITQIGVEQKLGDTYEWELYKDSTVNFAQVPGVSSADYADFVGSNSSSEVQIEWKKPGTYFFKVTAKSNCTNNLRIGKIKVLPSLPVAIPEVIPIEVCEGESADLLITFLGKAPWTVKIESKNNNETTEMSYSVGASSNPLRITVTPLITTEYRVIEVSNVYGTQKNPTDFVKLTVHPQPKKTPIYLKIP